MEDEEYDLDTLTALLDMEDEGEPNNTKSKSDNVSQDDEEVDLETITSFLEASDDDSDVEQDEASIQHKETQENKADDRLQATTEVTNDKNSKDNVETRGSSKENADVNSIQAQLLMMQEQMAKLQNQLLQQQSQTSPTTKSPQLSEKNSEKNSQKSKDHRHNTVSAEQTKISPSDHTGKKRQNSEKLRKSPGSSAYKREQVIKSLNNVSKCDQLILDRLLPPTDTEKQKMQRTETQVKNSSSKRSPKNSASQMVAECREKAVSSNRGVSHEDLNPFFDDENDSTSKGNTKQVEQDLKLESDDSDFEGLDGEEKFKLSDEGREISNLLKEGNSTSRVSHVSAHDVADLRKKAAKTQWKEKGVASHSGAEVKSSPAISKEENIPSVTDPFSGIRIVNPLVSSSDMKYRMKDRTMIKISRIAGRIGTSDLQGNWVTVGVVVSKTEPRQSSTGKTFCIWKLTDLQDCDKTVSFFLFGEVYKQLWKNNVKTVVGILNPSIMDKAEKVQKEVAFTVNHPQQVLVMGYSKDLGKCSGVSKAGKPCSNFINKEQGDRCTYHVQSAYSKTCSKRTELQGSYSGVTPKSQKQKFMSKKNESSFFFYGGETFTNTRPQTQNKNKVTLKNLQQKQLVNGKDKITTMSLHELDPEDEKKLKELKDKQNDFVDMLSTPSVGSMNFVKHLVKKEKQEKENTGSATPLVQSISAKDLLKQHQRDMKQRRKPITSPADPLAATPSLGKGSNPAGMVFLDFSSSKSKTGNLEMEAAKKLAIAKVLSKGSIKKEDPNAVKKKMSPEAQQKVKKRLAENLDDDVQSTARSEPPKKRSKLLGNVDIDSEEFKQLMKSRSKHKGALAQVEAEHEERYFMELEKREKYEDKMTSIMESKCKAFTCRQCNYTAYKPADRCKAENHSIKTIETIKRFFKCKKCKNRCTTIQKYPTEACRNCGGDSFERTSMHQERKGPKLASEELCIRGDEIKYLGSLQEKVYLNS